MTKFVAIALLTGFLAAPAFAPAFAQDIAPPAGAAAPPAVNASIAHHDRAVARRAYRHGHYRKAAIANHAANAAAIQANNPR